MTDECGGCIDRRGTAGPNWHRRHGTDLCVKARADEAAHNQAQRERRAEARDRVLGWIPGTPILVPEVDPL